ncbi:MAG: type III-B CRISPR module RAMP protein Cmr1 [Candidatus Electrothrix scaldis]|nr:MAG: type III-B CRISPR module RAMP protein Cmr1 [Candidatus Electrothrix sp. GW3-3]
MSVRNPKAKAEKLGVASPEDLLSNLKEQAEPAEKQKWLSYKIEVITPIFGGGVKAGEPDTKMPIRASAIRGQLRYWWRFLESAKIDMNKPGAKNELFKKERDIWGGMAEGEEDHSSKVRLRIKIDKNVLLRVQGQKRQYAEDEPKYALFPAREQTQTIPHQPAKYLIWPDPNGKTKLTFELLLSTPKKYREEVERVLRCVDNIRWHRSAYPAGLRKYTLLGPRAWSGWRTRGGSSRVRVEVSR